MTAFFTVLTEKPGDYQGTIQITFGEKELAIPVEVKVIPNGDSIQRILIASSPFRGDMGEDADYQRTLLEFTSSGRAEFHFVESVGAEGYPTSEYLSSFDVIVLQYLQLIHVGTDDEMVRLFQEYVRNGGRLIVLANAFMVGTVHSANELARPFGLKIDAGEIDDAEARDRRRLACREAQIESDVLTANVADLRFFRASPIVVTDAHIAKHLVRSPVRSRDGVASVARIGKGELILLTQTVLPMFLGDHALPIYQDVADNRKLFENLLFATKPE